MDRELVSVIIPAYNVDKFLGECVRSLLCQTYTNYEIIIIDDGSTDNTYVIGESLTFESTKVKVFRQENQGVSVARNVGMQKAKGEFYVFVDADDIVEVNLNNVYVNASGVIENILCGSNYDGYLWNKIFQKRIIENNNLKFLKNIVVWEDLLFVLQYLKNCSTIAVSNEKLYYYRNREGSAVNNNRLDKYLSKYKVMEEIKKQDFTCTEQSKKKTSFLYFETMFSYLNQILIRENKTNELAEILPNVDIVELLKLKNIKLFLKFLYLKIKGKLYKI